MVLIKSKSHMLRWSIFIVAGVFSRIICAAGYIQFRFEILSVIAGIQILFGLWLIKETNCVWFTVFIVSIGILIAQWWLVMLCIIIIGWSIAGW